MGNQVKSYKRSKRYKISTRRSKRSKRSKNLKKSKRIINLKKTNRLNKRYKKRRHSKIKHGGSDEGSAARRWVPPLCGDGADEGCTGADEGSTGADEGSAKRWNPRDPAHLWCCEPGDGESEGKCHMLCDFASAKDERTSLTEREQYAEHMAGRPPQEPAKYFGRSEYNKQSNNDLWNKAVRLGIDRNIVDIAELDQGADSKELVIDLIVHAMSQSGDSEALSPSVSRVTPSSSRVVDDDVDREVRELIPEELVTAALEVGMSKKTLLSAYSAAQASSIPNDVFYEVILPTHIATYEIDINRMYEFISKQIRSVNISPEVREQMLRAKTLEDLRNLRGIGLVDYTVTGAHLDAGEGVSGDGGDVTRHIDGDHKLMWDIALKRFLQFRARARSPPEPLPRPEGPPPPKGPPRAYPSDSVAWAAYKE